MAQLLPLFPLQLAVLPDEAVPLHIFEPRYREMVGEAAENKSEFGIVRIIGTHMTGIKDAERQGENGISNVGCSVVVEAVPARYPDGRFEVVTRGRRRFHVLSLDEAKTYLRGSVAFFDDEEDEEEIPEGLHARAMEAAGLAQTGMPQRSYSAFQLAARIDDPDFRTLLLECRSERERLRLFIDFAGPWRKRAEYLAHMKKKSPTNGSGHRSPGV